MSDKPDKWIGSVPCGTAQFNPEYVLWCEERTNAKEELIDKAKKVIKDKQSVIELTPEDQIRNNAYCECLDDVIEAIKDLDI